MTSDRDDFWVDAEDEEQLTPQPVFYADSEVEPEELHDDGGVSDAERIVRVWVSDGHLEKVRVSPNWHTKLARRKNATLGQVFTVVLQMAHVGVAAPSEVEPPTLELTPEFKQSLPELSEESLARVEEHYAKLRARFEHAKQEWAPQESSGAQVVGRVPGVRVRLDPRGRATTVEFDDKWLDGAQAGEIAASVMRAASDAYRRYQPGETQDELSPKMAREYEYMRQVMNTIMTPKERR